ncbi:MAG: 50S ribosomal protein L17 [Candidatus Dojkabacteria bacterium]|nr:50S ribosomal protein L17 [Candidatus Dojkabacteria bacterium]
MRHQKKGKKLSRTKSHREAVTSNLATSLILNEYIVTTITKAKVAKSYVDRVISAGMRKRGNPKQRMMQLLKNGLAVQKISDILLERFKGRTGGYTTIVKLGARKGDGARMAKLVLIGSEAVRKVKKKATKSKKKVKTQKQSEQKTEKKTLLDRVKGISGRFGSQGKRESLDKLGDRTTQEIKGKSRSGI